MTTTPAQACTSELLAAEQSAPAQALPYHRMMRTHPRYRWWRPLVTALLAAGIYLGFVLVIVVAGLITITVNPAAEMWINRAFAMDMNDPVTLAGTLAGIAVMMPAVMIAGRLMRGGGRGLTASVRGGLRWPLLARCLGWAAVVLVPSFALLQVWNGQLTLTVDRTAVIMLAIVAVLVPFQSAAEEYAFRGLLMQLVGSWLRHPVFAIVLPIPLFVIGHNYDVYGLADVAIFAIGVAWLTWKTGGLEAAIALHIVNNVAIFAMGAVGLVDLNNTQGSLIGVAITVVTTVAYAWLVATRERATATREPDGSYRA
ncbi:MAG: lysostaphin resistance A-like protein [Beutenbergiaceae bacterium]